MILAIDVHYTDSTAMVAGVLFDNWQAAEPVGEYTCLVENIAPYESGSFYKRELPCILALLEQQNLNVECIVIDGYVYLDGTTRPGLGKYLYDVFNGDVLVVGVAKNAFPEIPDEHKVFRGQSKSPLYVTSTGELSDAKNNIAKMAGEFRLPGLLKRVDQLCRTQ